MSKHKWDFRDVSLGLKKLREFLLGRKHTLHGRFPPIVSSRTVPPPDIPRGPEIKYSNHYYHQRNVMNSVLPPVVAPVAEGPPLNQDLKKKTEPGGIKPDTVCFSHAPTPGLPWWWDGHSYYECVPDTCPSKSQSQPQKCSPSSSPKNKC